MPFIAAPADTPIIDSSESGVSNTRSGPNRAARSFVVPNIAVGSSTPWPRTNTFGSCSSAIASASFTARAYVTTRPTLGSGRSYTSELTSPSSHGISICVHVPVEILFGRIRARERQLECVSDLRGNLILHFLNGCSVERSCSRQVLTKQRQRVDGFPGDALGLGSIAGLAVVAGAAVRPEAVDSHLDKRGSVAGSRTSDRAANGVVHSEHVDPVY